MKLVEVQTKEGLYIEEKVAFALDNPTMNRFMERLARALLSHAFNQEYFDGTVEWRFEQEIPHYIYEGMMQFGSVRKVSPEFAYGLTKVTNEHPSWIVVNFYGNTEFLICAKKT
jgi:hypothetical protein